jgi:hypothetical protein
MNATPRIPSAVKHAIPVFVALQALDIITTMLGIRLGASEGSAFVARLMSAGVLPGLLLTKLFAVVLICSALAVECPRVLSRANVWFAALITWNFVVIYTKVLA